MTDPGRFKLRACGANVTIFEWVRLLGAETTTIGSHVIVDDFVFLDGRGDLAIGDHVHIASFASVVGAGEVVLEDFSALASGARLVSGTDVMDGSGLLGPTIPPQWRAVKRGYIHVGRHALVGTNAVVHPDVTIGEGAIIGSCSLVTRDVEPWTICIGVPARAVRSRPRETVEAYEEALRKASG